MNQMHPVLLRCVQRRRFHVCHHLVIRRRMTGKMSIGISRRRVASRGSKMKSDRMIDFLMQFVQASVLDNTFFVTPINNNPRFIASGMSGTQEMKQLQDGIPMV